MSRVQSGKIVAFDGRYLHCAPSALATMWGAPKANAGPRVTLLVNIWFHTPKDALRCPFKDDDYEFQSRFRTELPRGDKIPKIVFSEGSNVEIDLGGTNLSLECIVDTYAVVAKACTSVEISWAKEELCQIQKKRKKEKKKK